MISWLTSLNVVVVIIIIIIIIRESKSSDWAGRVEDTSGLQVSQARVPGGSILFLPGVRDVHAVHQALPPRHQPDQGSGLKAACWTGRDRLQELLAPQLSPGQASHTPLCKTQGRQDFPPGFTPPPRSQPTSHMYDLSPPPPRTCPQTPRTRLECLAHVVHRPCHQVTALLKQAAETRAGPAPTSPALGTWQRTHITPLIVFSGHVGGCLSCGA